MSGKSLYAGQKQNSGVGRGSRVLLVLLCVLLALSVCVSPVAAEESSSEKGRWEAAADEIDQYLDAAFEYYLEGDATNAYNAVNDAYFKVYETTGMERQTLSYISGPRKNAVELQYSTCKAEVKKENDDDEIKTEVRTALAKLKSMIREDANKLAEKDGESQSVTKYYLNGEMVSADPYADLTGDPNAAVTYANCAEISDAIAELLDTAFLGYKGKDFEAAIDNIRTSYYSVYEESGFSQRIFAELSVEEREELDKRYFSLMDLVEGESFQRRAVQREIRELKNVIASKAAALDALDEAAAAEEAAQAAAAAEESGSSMSQGMVTLLGSFGIIFREGLEAILVIAAIIAYLKTSGNQKSLRDVYIGGVAGIAMSFVAALILYYVKEAVAGAGQSQELVEGITALIAVCVLFYVSNWMISKSEAAAWSNYIDSKVQSSVARGSAFALAFTAFLSVFREGAEVILFYQPMFSEGYPEMVWAGFGIGCFVLVFVYLAITKLSVRLPLNVFFTATSILMAVMCVSFLGSGIKELAEAGVFDVTMNVPGIPENEYIQILGIYPYLETLVPQILLSIVLIVTFLAAHYRNKLKLKDAEIERLTGLLPEESSAPESREEIPDSSGP